jgi:protein arginine kinase activator
MGTKCDRCDNEATVHALRRIDGHWVERHLCESCASTEGVDIPTGGGPVIVELSKPVVTVAATQPPTASAAPPGPPAPAMGRLPVCINCKTSFNDFKQQGMLGCPECYRCFEAFLGPMIERAQEGGVAHVGKTPKRLLSGAPASPTSVHASIEPAEIQRRLALAAEQNAVRVKALQRQLDQAIAAEQYEQAAKLRDEMRRLANPAAEGESPRHV